MLVYGVKVRKWLRHTSLHCLVIGFFLCHCQNFSRITLLYKMFSTRTTTQFEGLPIYTLIAKFIYTTSTSFALSLIYTFISKQKI